MSTRRGLAARGFSAIRISSGTITVARPVGNLAEVERRELRQQHDLQRHHRHRAPGHLAEERQRRAREDVGLGGAAMGEDRRARPRHVRCRGIVAGQLQRVVGLDRGADVELAAVEQRPAAMVGLGGAQIGGQLALDRVVDRVEEMLEQDVLGGDGDVGLELEAPVALGVLQRLQVGGRLGDDAVDLVETVVPPRRRQFPKGLCRTAIEHDHKTTFIAAGCRCGGRVPAIGTPADDCWARTKRAAVRPERRAPSMVAGRPVAVQSPARNRLK